ncbi:TonB-dependent receptor [Flammeovirga sp. SubArs3]|uniref:TonB-dependent receptor plug domain-containing protein n=1 Tax=Flammeovirga sp. SubArs3 TaxID=2995316 RepID=UPI00248AE104|nr:TonB-dependent receptor [Flammeovirga sp. SubArs3]
MKSLKLLIGSMLFLVLLPITSTFAQAQLKTYYLGEVTITSDTIENKDYQLTIDQVMAEKPEMNIVKRGGFAWEPIINGYSDGQIAVVIDGMRVFGACTDKMDPATSYLEPINLESFDVLRSSDAQEFGTSLGGSINASMKYPNFDGETHFGIQNFYSTNTNGYDGNIFLEKSSEKFGVRYSGAYRKHQSYTDGNGELVPYTQYQKQNHTLTSGYKLSENETLTAMLMFDQGKDIGYPALPMDVSSATGIMGNIGYKKHDDQAKFQHLEAKVYYNFIEHIMDDTNRENVAIRMDMPGRSNTFGAWAKLGRKTEKHQFSIKVDAFANHLFADMTMYSPTGGKDMYMITWGDIQRYSIATFLKDTWKLDDRLEWENSIRIESNSINLSNELARKQFETLNYTVDGPISQLGGTFSSAFNYHLTESITSSFGINYTHRLPTASELYGYYLFNARDRFDYIGNPDLDTEKAFDFIFNLEYNSDGWVLGMSARKVFINDYIVGIVQEDLLPMTIGALGVKKYMNVGKANSSHLNIYGSKLISNWLKYGIHLSFDNGTIEELHSSMPYMQPLTVKQNIQLQLKNFAFGVEYVYNSGMSTPAEELGELPTSSYHLFNLQGEYALDLNKGELKFIGAVQNIFDAYYIDPFAWNEIPSSGRNIKLGINYNF